MVWQDYAAEIRDVLELEGNPVAVTYSMKPPSEAAEGKHRVCDALLEARNGKIIDLTAATSACAGEPGTWVWANVQREKPTGRSKNFWSMARSSTAP